MLCRIVRLRDITKRARVDCRGLRIECQAQISFDACHWRAHFVAGGADEFGALPLVAFFVRDVAKRNDNAVAERANWADRDARQKRFARLSFDT